MFLDSTQYKNNTRTVSGTPTIYPNDVVLLCDTSSAPVVINLLEIPNDYWQVNYKIYVVDAANNSATNNITINAGTGQTINNSTSVIVSTNGATTIIFISSNNSYNTNGGNNTLTQLVTQNTVYVKKNGNDSTGVCEREDLPFKTILAARNAALSFFPTRSPILRVRIKVDSGFYQDIIYVDDFIDYDLGNANVTGSTAGIPTIYAPSTNSYTLTSDGIPNCIIYGVATISNLFVNTATIELQGTNLKMVLFCNNIFGEQFEAILMRTSNLLVYANLINMNIPADSLRQCINLATNNSYTQTPTLEINGAKIYTLQTGSTNSIIEIYNGELGSTLNLNYSNLTLNNCQLGSWAANRAAIECPSPKSGTLQSRGYGKIVLTNTIIFSNAAFSVGANIYRGCINDYYYDSDRGALSVYAYSVYSNKQYSLTNPLSKMYVNNVLVDTNIQFNNGVII